MSTEAIKKEKEKNVNESGTNTTVQLANRAVRHGTACSGDSTARMRHGSGMLLIVSCRARHAVSNSSEGTAWRPGTIRSARGFFSTSDELVPRGGGAVDVVCLSTWRPSISSDDLGGWAVVENGKKGATWATPAMGSSGGGRQRWSTSWTRGVVPTFRSRRGEEQVVWDHMDYMCCKKKNFAGGTFSTVRPPSSQFLAPPLAVVQDPTTGLGVYLGTCLWQANPSPIRSPKRGR